MLEGIFEMGLHCLPWNQHSTQLQHRYSIAHRFFGGTMAGSQPGNVGKGTWKLNPVPPDQPAMSPGPAESGPGNGSLGPFAMGASNRARSLAAQHTPGALREDHPHRLPQWNPSSGSETTGDVRMCHYTKASGRRSPDHHPIAFPGL